MDHGGALGQGVQHCPGADDSTVSLDQVGDQGAQTLEELHSHGEAILGLVKIMVGSANNSGE